MNSTLLLIKRGIAKNLKEPMGMISGLGMSIFFLVVYSAGIGGIDFLPQFETGGYFAFLFPLGIVSLSMGSSSGAGVLLNRDIESGYFKRIFLSPASRWVFAGSAIIADAVATVFATSVLILIGIVMGLPLANGFQSFIGLIVISILWGTILSGLSSAVMLRTGNHQTAQTVLSAVFPLLFLSNTFMPEELITADWLLIASRFNPLTYIMNSLRFFITGDGSWSMVIASITGLTIASGLAVLFSIKSVNKTLV